MIIEEFEKPTLTRVFFNNSDEKQKIFSEVIETGRCEDTLYFKDRFGKRYLLNWRNINFIQFD